MSDKVGDRETGGKSKVPKKDKKGKKRQRDEDQNETEMQEPPKLKLDDIFLIEYRGRERCWTPYILLRETKCFWILSRVETEEVSRESDGYYGQTIHIKLVLPIQITSPEIRVKKKTLEVVGDHRNSIKPVPITDLANFMLHEYIRDDS